MRTAFLNFALYLFDDGADIRFDFRSVVEIFDEVRQASEPVGRHPFDFIIQRIEEDREHLLEIPFLVVRLQIVRYLAEGMSSGIPNFRVVVHRRLLNEIVDRL